MRRNARFRGRLLVVVAAVGALFAPAVSWADGGADVTVSNIRPQLGEEVTVTGSGFTPGDRVGFRVCGAPDETGRLACTEGRTGLEIAFDGTVRDTLEVDAPPGPCPCSVVVDTPGAPPVSAPVNLVGHATAKAVKAPDLVVDAATLTPDGGLGRWFGAAPDLTLTLTLRNAGVAPAEPTLNLNWRDGDDDGQPITDTGLPLVEPGEIVDVDVPLTVGRLAQGEHTVSGQIVVGDLYAPVDTSTSLAPWGLYLLALGGFGALAVVRVRKATSGEAALIPAGLIPQRKPVDRRPGRRAATSATEQVVPAPRTDSSPSPSPSPDPAPSRSRRGAEEPAYVGPPRLESTPLATPPGGRTLTVESPTTPGAEVTQDAPRVPQQSSPFRQQSTVAAQSDVVRNSTPEQDSATVSEALAAIRDRAGQAPARLPDPHEVVPSGKRAERGGKRAARPEKGQRWLTRR